MDKAQDLRRQGRKKLAQALRKQAQHLPSGDPKDSTYRRLKYCRYADDFLLGFVGPRAEAEVIKQQLETFLRDELNLELSQSKTLITHARSQSARFLGYEITTLQQDSKHCMGKDGKERRSINGTIGLRIPREVVQDKCHRYLKDGKAIHRAELRNESDYSIIAAYQATFRGIANYYRLAYNLHSLNRLKWVMEQSLTKTLANKHHLTVPKVYQRYAATAEMNGTTCKTLQAVVLREKKKPLIATWGGVSLKWDIQADLEDGNPHPTWIGRSELEKRLVAQVCELCGASWQTDPIEVHHIRALKDLTRYTGRERPLWVKTMAARRRKTLVLCRTCHQDIQHGRPMRRQNLKHMNASPVPTG